MLKTNNIGISLFRLAELLTALICYRPSVISVTVTKGGHLRGNKLYKTSKTIGQGVSQIT